MFSFTHLFFLLSLLVFSCSFMISRLGNQCRRLHKQKLSDSDDQLVAKCMEEAANYVSDPNNRTRLAISYLIAQKDKDAEMAQVLAQKNAEILILNLTLTYQKNSEISLLKNAFDNKILISKSANRKKLSALTQRCHFVNFFPRFFVKGFYSILKKCYRKVFPGYHCQNDSQQHIADCCCCSCRGYEEQQFEKDFNL